MQKEFHVKLTGSAESDLVAIWEFISLDSPLNAVDFLVQLEQSIYSLAIFPERNPIIPEVLFLPTREYRHHINKDYRIVYRVGAQTVYVLRVFHGSKLLDIASLER